MSRPGAPSRLRALALIAACVATLGVAACGGDDDEGAGTTTTGTEAAETTTATEATTTTTGTSAEEVDVDALRDQFNEQLHAVLTDEQGLTPSQADCAIDELQDSLTDEALQQVAETGEPPKDLIDAAFDAGAACKDE